ncbi:YidC/Oxa1 family membrane protein insertase [Hydrogenivirga caldilitoris]|uniref:Membrane protein insertase YidC n=2 Tax=Hydrogenivirga caldilitoris TaxID=246264 RepID=A0A497XP27_9AQUI|nr:YidC/Oxa1 family membrane protein insertase [Hydrogenivirga caldilitoris]
MTLIAFFLLGYELFSSYFLRPAPQQTPPPQQEQTAKEVKKTEPEEKASAPQLMLGTTREKKKPVKTLKYDVGSFSIEVSPEGGRIVSFVDKQFGFDLITEAEKKLNVYPLEVYTGNPDIDYDLNFGEYKIEKREDKLILTFKKGGKELTKELEFKDFYVKLTVKSNLNRKVYVLVGTHPFEASFYTHEGPVLKLGGEVLRIDKDDIKAREFIEGNIEFAGEESRYFFKGFKGKISHVVINKVSYKPEGEEKEKEITFTYVGYDEPLTLYMGAKYYSRLRELELSDLLDWGMLKVAVKPLFIFMYWVYEHTGSWVLSIVILTFLLRLVFFPLNYKSTTSMMKLQEAAPQLEKIKKKYKDDPVKMQQEMMKLYSEIGFNPMSGCLPILVQIPVFFALYKVLIITVDLKLSGMLWIHSLADKDPFYILPVIMGLTMILQQKFTPNPDPKQNLIMYISAVAFTFLFANFPSGLVLYWTVNNILNIGQNYLIKNVILKKR